MFGIYYVDTVRCDFSKRHSNGSSRFYDTKTHADHYLDAGTLYLNAEGVWDIELSEGQIVLFPSCVKQSTLPYFSKTDRVIIAFNGQVNFIK